MNWQMQHIFLRSRQQAIATLAQRFNVDVAHYHNTMPTLAAVQKVIDLRALGDTAIWVEASDSHPIAHSATMTMGTWQEDALTQYLQALPAKTQLTIDTVGDRTLLTCVTPFVVDGTPIGTLFIVEDITQSQRAFQTITRRLVLVSGGAIAGLATLLALYVRRALHPLETVSQAVMTVTPDSLAQTRLHLDEAPTEVKELAQALDYALERLTQAWAQQRRLVGDVSHELRTPLTLVQGYLQSTLRRCHTLTDTQREGLETAATETDRTIRLLNDLLILARADTRAMQGSQERLDLKKFLLETIAVADPTGDRIFPEIETAPLWVQADPHALRQVLINLLNNALTYSPSTAPVIVWLSQAQDQAILQVCDRGRGIPLADQENIFEPFYRVDTDRCRTTGGTGLGLAIAKTLLAKMNGTISVQSQLGEGSTFTIHLPICHGGIR
jgi:signal transduction histidine kinase